ncbi:TetR/AcrR family transcriptional regulator [Spirillospora sp. NPDC029432]|uniref:TetR/AcrR family transcriptional regulator n=1 Tax=Spirillospora sp. NPDC029432 TaxID=3154599 RepID=UPI003453E2F8
MGRWEPNARGRLEQAALELYGERGFERTTVVEIARRAGVTERTYFRHYADKREVLFAGSDLLRDLMEQAVARAPASAPPIEATTAALEAAASVIPDHAQARRRQAIIEANAELRERELIKLATLAEALTGALRGRGVPEPAASLAAETGIAVFKVAFERWIGDTGEADLPHYIRESLDALRTVTAEPARR